MYLNTLKQKHPMWLVSGITVTRARSRVYQDS